MVVNGVHVSIVADSAPREPQPHIKLEVFHENLDTQNAAANLYCVPGKVQNGADGSICVL